MKIDKINGSRLFVLISFIAVTHLAAKAQRNASFGTDNFALNFGWCTFLSNKQSFLPNNNDRSDVKLFSKPRVNFAGKVELSKLYGDHFEVSLGMFGGGYPIDFSYSFDSTFSIHGHASSNYSVDRAGAVFMGANIMIGYQKMFLVKHFVSARLGVNSIYFIPSFYGYTVHSIWDNVNYKIFEADANINPNGRIIFAPEISIRYHYSLFNKYMPYISMNGVYSNSYPVVGYNYSLYGKNETLTGTFKRRFMHVGIEVGVRIL